MATHLGGGCGRVLSGDRPMLKPNWFDDEFGEATDKASAQEILLQIARTPKVVERLTSELADFDHQQQTLPLAGPSRSQVVRRVLADVLNED